MNAELPLVRRYDLTVTTAGAWQEMTPSENGDYCDNDDREARERILQARIAELTADRDAARRERDEAIQAKESAELEVAYLANEMVYEGNSIGWIASKAKNYGVALMAAWDGVKAIGGKCDGSTPLHEAIRQQLVAKDAGTERLQMTVQELGLRNAELEADAERYRDALNWIATVNAMDHEYVRVARFALGVAQEAK